MADCKFLFITANVHEKTAFTEKFNDKKSESYPGGIKIVYGRFGKYRVAHYHVPQGTESQAAIDSAIKITNAKAVVLVGIACGGVDFSNENIGDVLIADKILDYDNHKDNPGKTELRGFVQRCGNLLLTVFRNYADDWERTTVTEDYQTKTFIGTIISSAVLLNDPKQKKKIFGAAYDYPIGYEMEGASAVRACSANSIAEFILVKGISDLGDGEKNLNKEARQKYSASKAVSLCHYVFSHANLDDPKEDKNAEEIYLPSSFHKTNINVVGRETDISTIHNAFIKDYIIALHGDGGIGKTITAEYYADSLKDEYKTINHLQFSGSVQNTLMSLMEEWELKGFDGLSHDDRWNIIKNKLKNLTYNILIVIHINDESITRLTDYDNLKYGKNVKFLFTTRVKKLPPCRMIEIEPLSDDEIKQIFINNACDKEYKAVIEKDITDHKEQFDEIVKRYCKNTMLITLTARVKNAADKNIAELCELIKKDSLVSTEITNVEITKDSELPDVFPIKEHIKKLYSIANLSDEQVDFLRNMSLMDYSGIPLEKFNEWMELTNNNTANSLEKIGIVHYEYNSDGKKIIYMHPAVSDAVFEQTGAGSGTCEKFLVKLYNMEHDMDYLHERRYLIPILEFICDRIGGKETILTSRFFNLSSNLFSTFGYYQEALQYNSNALIICEKVFGEKNENTANLYNANGLLYFNMFKHEEALVCFKKALKIW
jgi:nucleoside phosphorylase